jgi:hypothetical protein
MGFSGQVYTEKVFATFQIFFWKFEILIKHTLMQDSFAPHKASSGPFKNLNIFLAKYLKLGHKYLLRFKF